MIIRETLSIEFTTSMPPMDCACVVIVQRKGETFARSAWYDADSQTFIADDDTIISPRDVRALTTDAAIARAFNQ